MIFKAVLIILSVNLLSTCLAWSAAPECSAIFSNDVSFPIDSKWDSAAAAFIKALNNREEGTFPAEVNGLSLIAPSKLVGLDRNYRGPVKIARIESVTLKKDSDRFLIQMNYFVEGETTSRINITASNEFYIWRNYLRKVLNRRGEALILDMDSLPQPPPFDRKAYTEDLLKRNNFNTERTMTEYKENFGAGFGRSLKNLNRGDQTWIDMGAGSALAQRTFLNARLKKSSPQDIPRLRPVSYKIPNNPAVIHKIEEKLPGVFQYIEGKQSPTSIRRMEKADLITDVVGIAQYSDKPLEMVKAYIDILKPEGHIWVSPFQEIYLQLPEAYLKKIDLDVVELKDGGEALHIRRLP